MTDWIAVSREKQADQHFLPRDGFDFASTQPVATILLAELTKLLPHYALAFIQQGDGFQPVALLSLDGQTNLYVAPNGKWLGSYVPALMRGYPFTLANAEEGKQVLAIDQTHLTQDQGEPLFDDEGKLATKASQTLDFLQQCEKNRQVTLASTQALNDAGVIEAWPLEIDRGEGQEPLKLQGLYRINEKALNALEADEYAKLKGGPMTLAYAQLFSMSQLNHLVERAKFHAQQNEQVDSAQALEDIFEDDGGLNFDFH